MKSEGDRALGSFWNIQRKKIADMIVGQKLISKNYCHGENRKKGKKRRKAIDREGIVHTEDIGACNHQQRERGTLRDIRAPVAKQFFDRISRLVSGPPTVSSFYSRLAEDMKHQKWTAVSPFNGKTIGNFLAMQTYGAHGFFALSFIYRFFERFKI